MPCTLHPDLTLMGDEASPLPYTIVETYSDHGISVYSPGFVEDFDCYNGAHCYNGARSLYFSEGTVLLVRSDNPGERLWTIERIRNGRARFEPETRSPDRGAAARLYGRIEWVECWPKGGPTGKAVAEAIRHLLSARDIEDHPDLLAAYRMLAGHANPRVFNSEDHDA